HSSWSAPEPRAPCYHGKASLRPIAIRCPSTADLRYRGPHRSSTVAADTIVSRLFEQAKKQPSSPAYYVRQGGGWKPTNWRDYAAEVKQAARALISLGFEPGNNVSVLGFNRPEWAVTVLAAMAARGAAAGIYTTC